jgi:hypothetical protein
LKTYHLKAVEYEGKTFTNCSLVLDVDARKAEVKRPAGLLRRDMVLLADLSWGGGAPVQVDGAAVRSGPVTFTADDNATALEISKALQGEEPAAAQLAGKLAAIREPMYNFLKKRAEGIEFLVELKTNPRQALVDVSPSFSGMYENPALEYLMKFSSTLAEAHAKMTYAAAEVQESIGTAAVDRIFAFVCAVGVFQDGLVTGTGFTEELGAFMEELGLEGTAVSEPDVKKGTEAMLRRSDSLFSVPAASQ